jgi:hypothetical protein
MLGEARVGGIAQLRIRERAVGGKREKERNVQSMLPKLLPGSVIRIL